MRNSAKWHKPCWLLCSKTQVDRARRRKEKLQPTTKVGWVRASIRGDESTRPIYRTTAQIAINVFVYPCYHIADEEKHKKKQDFNILSTKYDFVDL